MTSHLSTIFIPKLAVRVLQPARVATSIRPFASKSDKVEEELEKGYAKRPAQTAAEINEKGKTQTTKKVKEDVTDNEKGNRENSHGPAAGAKKQEEEKIQKSATGTSLGKDGTKPGSAKQAPKGKY